MFQNRQDKLQEMDNILTVSTSHHNIIEIYNKFQIKGYSHIIYHKSSMQYLFGHILVNNSF